MKVLGVLPRHGGQSLPEKVLAGLRPEGAKEGTGRKAGRAAHAKAPSRRIQGLSRKKNKAI